MPNALDVIQVKYGQKTGEEKTISYLSFLELDSSNLSENEEKLQQVMKKLYHLNENKYPLYNVFSNWQVDKPLTINLIEKPFETNYDGAFVKDVNDIRFNEDAFDEELFVTLVHELKHAEDFTKESYDFENKCRLDEGLSYHQMGILLESRAKACELTVLMMDCLDQKKSVEEFVSKMNGYSLGYLCKAIMPEIKKRYEKALAFGQELDAQDMQQIATVVIVPKFIGSALYKETYFSFYNKICEIKPSDKGLKKMPASWNILPQYQKPLLTVLRGSFKNGQPKGMVPTDVLKKLNVAFDISAFLFVALENGLLEETKALMKQGADINLKNEEEWSILHSAVYYSQTKAVEVLLQVGADKNIKNKYGNTPMHLAAKYADMNIVKALIKAGVDLSVKNKYGETPLDTAYNRLICDQNEKEPSKKLTDQERQNLLLRIDFLEKQKAPHGRCFKAQVDGFKRNNALVLTAVRLKSCGHERL